MNTQKKIAEKIIEKKGDYVMPLKKNHLQFQSEVEAYFHKISRDCPEMLETFEEVNAERSRIDERYYRKLKVSDWLSKAEEWKGIKSVLEVCRKRSDNGKESQEKVFYISSLDVDIQILAKCVRGHWEVENKAHWVLDVVYKEDECAVTDEWGAENLAILHRLALNLARLHPKKQSMKGKLTAA
ncbi:ISAs1 family transposase, partial [Glaesserella parasuis]|nr:ISAs1 family transposase [Glaesserella parasuis]